LDAKSLNIDNVSKRGLAKNLTLKLFNKNVLYLPWIPFSISSERTSGFLEPSLSYSSDGLDSSIPYYRVLSSTSDLTIAPRMIASRGTGLEFNIRKAHNKKFIRNLDFIYLSKDKEFSREFEEKKENRWAYSLEDSFEYKNYIGYLDWSKSSDQMVLRDIPGENVSIGNQRSENLPQTLFFKASYSNLDISLKHEGYQSLNPILTNGYKKSPEVNVNYRRNIDQFNVSYRMNYAKFDADLIHGYFGYKTMGGYIYRDDNPIEGSRIYSSFNIENEKIYKNLKISSEFGFKNIAYDIKNSMMDASDVTVPNALVKLSSSFFNSSNASVNIIEPKLVLGYVGYEDQINNPVFDSDELSPNNQLFNNHRFSGLDRIGDQKFYTVGLSYQKIVSGMKKVKVDISKKMYLEDRKVWLNPMTEMNMSTGMTMHAEPIVAMASFMPNKNSMIMMYGGLDKETDSMMLGGLNLKKSFAKGSVGYSRRYRRMAGSFNVEMDYSETFAAYKITPNINLLAKLKRDHATDINIESLVGLKYQNCCIGVQLTFSNKELSKYIGFDSNQNYQYLDNAWNNIIDIENKSRINLSFELKGFNSSFDKMSRLFNNSLLNY
jgi:LPS-assembly protein